MDVDLHDYDLLAGVFVVLAGREGLRRGAALVAPWEVGADPFLVRQAFRFEVPLQMWVEVVYKVGESSPGGPWEAVPVRALVDVPCRMVGVAAKDGGDVDPAVALQCRDKGDVWQHAFVPFRELLLGEEVRVILVGDLQLFWQARCLVCLHGQEWDGGEVAIGDEVGTLFFFFFFFHLCSGAEAVHDDQV